MNTPSLTVLIASLATATGLAPGCCGFAFTRARPRAALSCSAASLIKAAARAGTVGTDANEADRSAVEAAAEALRGQGAREPARVPLRGTYELLYSGSPGGSSGKLGPFTGVVTQIIKGETDFINRVELGPLQVSLAAQREVLDGERIRVTFVETVVRLWGREVLRKPTSGAGVWKQAFVDEGGDGSATLRVMQTPSWFVLKQKRSE